MLCCFFLNFFGKYLVCLSLVNNCKCGNLVFFLSLGFFLIAEKNKKKTENMFVQASFACFGALFLMTHWVNIVNAGIIQSFFLFFIFLNCNSILLHVFFQNHIFLKNMIGTFVQFIAIFHKIWKCKFAIDILIFKKINIKINLESKKKSKPTKKVNPDSKN